MFRLVLFLSAVTALAAAAPVINEIHCEPPDKTRPVQFIEIHNPDAAPLSLAGWRLMEAVDFTFPAGTTLAAGGT